MSDPFQRGFASDNNAGVHPSVMEAMVAINRGHTIAYGDDPVTARAIESMKKHFGPACEVFFVFIGTAANVLGLSSVTQPYHAVVCTDTAHIHVDECGAPEKFAGCKLLPVKTMDGKLTPELIASQMQGIGFEHHVQPKVVSITQATELGTLYTLEEIRAIADYAHGEGMWVHMDGARISNAAAALDCSLHELTGGSGVDVLSFGGTKNGMMYGEAVVFFRADLAEDFKYRRKQGMQLASKMRYIAAQFEAYLQHDLWLANAKHANAMAQKLHQAVKGIKGVEITQDVEANAVFAKVPSEIIAPLQEEFFFYVWDETQSEVRWMCSFDTQETDIDSFTAALKSLLS